jgi:hypothetical protein
MSTEDLQFRIAQLEGEIASLRAVVEELVNPLYSPVFVADAPDAPRWQEQAMVNGAFMAFEEGRKCDDEAEGNALIELDGSKTFVFQVRDLGADQLRYVAIRGENKGTLRGQHRVMVVDNVPGWQFPEYRPDPPP